MNRAGLCGVLLICMWNSACGYRYWLGRLPNHDKIPCPPGTDCGDDKLCGAPGHVNCQSGEEDDFGEFFFSYEIWNQQVCQADTDGDSLTNGDEMGDPCCVWNVGSPTRSFPSLSHPASAGSKHDRVSCTLNGSPDSRQLGLTIEKSSLAYNVVPQSSCVCSMIVTVFSDNQVISREIFSPSNLTDTRKICYTSVNASAINWEVQVVAVNRAGKSQVFAIPFSPVPADAAASCPTAEITEFNQYMNQAATKEITFKKEPLSIYVIVSLSVLLVGVLFLLLINTCCFHSPQSFWQRLFWKRMFPSSVKTNKLPGWRYIAEMTYAELLCCIGVLAVVIVCMIVYTNYYASLSYGNSPPLTWVRALGASAAFPICVVLLCVCKHSMWYYAANAPFERTLKVHRYIGVLGLLLMLIHGIVMFIGFLASSKFGAKLLFSNHGLMLPILPATIALFLTLVWGPLALIEPVRRKFYGIFFKSHLLSIPTVILLIFHWRPLLLFFVPPLVLLGFDWLWLLLDAAKGAKVVSIKPLGVDPHQGGGQDGAKGGGTRYVDMIVQCNQAAYRHKTAQWAWLFIPKCGWTPHPFTVCSCPRWSGQPQKVDEEALTSTGLCFGDHTNKMRFFIKVNANKWTEKLWNLAKMGVAPTCLAFGPFGGLEVDFLAHDHVVLMAGGVGVTPMLALWTDWSMQAKAHPNAIMPKSITFLFRFKESVLAGALAPQFLEMPPQQRWGNTDWSLQLMQSGADNSPMDPVSEGGYKNLVNQGVLQVGPRPNLKQTVSGLLQHYGSPATVAVGVCGPQPMIDDVHIHAAELEMQFSGSRVNVHTETFDF